MPTVRDSGSPSLFLLEYSMDRNLLLPALAGGIFIISLCFYEQFYLKDYWGEPGAEAAELGKRFEQVPKQIGDWVGEDLPVDEIVKNTAGAVNYVSRRYKNEKTGRVVTLWLIVGHSRDVCRHTPNICYPASGFRQDGIQIKHHMELPSDKTADFFTGKFIKDDAFGRRVERVFWAWNHPEHDHWEAADYPRVHYGLSRALYKVYFTSDVLVDENTADENVAAEFAELMLPSINEALFPKDTEHLTSISEGVVEDSEKSADQEVVEEVINE